MSHNSIALSPRPVRPRDAASLLIYRHRSGALEVLLGRRGSRARFLPDVYVFPGGALAPQDGVHDALLGVPGYLGEVGARGSARYAWALARAALREVHEETGLQLRPSGREAQAADLTALRFLGRAITSVASPVRFHARFFYAPADHFEGALGGDGELQDLRWVAAHNPDNLPLVDVTEFMLAELVRVLSGEPTGAPLMTYTRGKPRISRR